MGKHTGHFSLWGDFDVEEITVLLGMEPSWVLRKGDRLDDLTSPAKVSTWDLHCPAETDDVNEQIRTLLDLLSPKTDQVKSLASQFHADLNVACSCEDGTILLSLNRELLQKLAALNLNLNCFYICGDPENGN